MVTFRRQETTMTRINAGIPVRCLTDEHLLAEHRELKRLPWCLENAIASGSIKNIPEKFTLGKGHVLFFLDKMGFTLVRYYKVHWECKRRGFNVQSYWHNWDNVPAMYANAYSPTGECVKELLLRIEERIAGSKKTTWHYCGKPISKEKAIKVLYNGYDAAAEDWDKNKFYPDPKIYVKGEDLQKK